MMKRGFLQFLRIFLVESSQIQDFAGTDLVCEGSTALYQACPRVGEEGLVPWQTLTRFVVSGQQQVLCAVGVGEVIAMVVSKASVLELWL